MRKHILGMNKIFDVEMFRQRTEYDPRAGLHVPPERGDFNCAVRTPGRPVQELWRPGAGGRAGPDTGARHRVRVSSPQKNRCLGLRRAQCRSE